jgi:hypothetical protein
LGLPELPVSAGSYWCGLHHQTLVENHWRTHQRRDTNTFISRCATKPPIQQVVVLLERISSYYVSHMTTTYTTTHTTTLLQ